MGSQWHSLLIPPLCCVIVDKFFPLSGLRIAQLEGALDIILLLGVTMREEVTCQTGLPQRWPQL